MKKRLKEMEDEAAALREMQAKVEKEMGAIQGLFRTLTFFSSFFFSHSSSSILVIMNLPCYSNLPDLLLFFFVFFWFVCALD